MKITRRKGWCFKPPTSFTDTLAARKPPGILFQTRGKWWNKLPTSTGACRISEPSTVWKGEVLWQSMIVSERGAMLWFKIPGSKHHNQHQQNVKMNIHVATPTWIATKEPKSPFLEPFQYLPGTCNYRIVRCEPFWMSWHIRKKTQEQIGATLLSVNQLVNFTFWWRQVKSFSDTQQLVRQKAELFVLLSEASLVRLVATILECQYLGICNWFVTPIVM